MPYELTTLPLQIIAYLAANHLPREARANLSQTCRVLHYALANETLCHQKVLNYSSAPRKRDKETWRDYYQRCIVDSLSSCYLSTMVHEAVRVLKQASSIDADKHVAAQLSLLQRLEKSDKLYASNQLLDCINKAVENRALCSLQVWQRYVPADIFKIKIQLLLAQGVLYGAVESYDLTRFLLTVVDAATAQTSILSPRENMHETPLSRACMKASNQATVHYLLSFFELSLLPPLLLGTSETCAPLRNAFATGNCDFIQSLCRIIPSKELPDYLRQQGFYGMTVLHGVAESGKIDAYELTPVDIRQELLWIKASDGAIPLMSALAGGHVTLSRRLLADMIAPIPSIRPHLLSLDQNGLHALAHAASSGNSDCCDMVLAELPPRDHAMLINSFTAKDNQTLLHLACNQKNLELACLVTLLAPLTADKRAALVMRVDKDGVSAMHRLAIHGQEQCYHYLAAQLTGEQFAVIMSTRATATTSDGQVENDALPCHVVLRRLHHASPYSFTMLLSVLANTIESDRLDAIKKVMGIKGLLSVVIQCGVSDEQFTRLLNLLPNTAFNTCFSPQAQADNDRRIRILNVAMQHHRPTLALLILQKLTPPISAEVILHEGDKMVMRMVSANLPIAEILAWLDQLFALLSPAVTQAIFFPEPKASTAGSFAAEMPQPLLTLVQFGRSELFAELLKRPSFIAAVNEERSAGAFLHGGSTSDNSAVNHDNMIKKIQKQMDFASILKTALQSRDSQMVPLVLKIIPEHYWQAIFKEIIFGRADKACLSCVELAQRFSALSLPAETLLSIHRAIFVAVIDSKDVESIKAILTQFGNQFIHERNSQGMTVFHQIVSKATRGFIPEDGAIQIMDLLVLHGGNICLNNAEGEDPLAYYERVCWNPLAKANIKAYLLRALVPSCIQDYINDNHQHMKQSPLAVGGLFANTTTIKACIEAAEALLSQFQNGQYDATALTQHLEAINQSEHLTFFHQALKECYVSQAPRLSL